jgi:hypothetical protein
MFQGDDVLRELEELRLLVRNHIGYLKFESQRQLKMREPLLEVGIAVRKRHLELFFFGRTKHEHPVRVPPK